MPKSLDEQELLNFELRSIVIELHTRKKDVVQIHKFLPELDKRFKDVELIQIMEIVQEYIKSTDDFVRDNPDFLDDKSRLVLTHIQELDRIIGQQWLLFEDMPVEHSKVKDNILKNITNTISEKAKLQQLFDIDKERDKKLKEALEANQKLVLLMRDVVNDCPICKNKLLQVIGQHTRLVVST